MNSHLKKYSPLFKQEGITQDERYLPALDPENIALDDRKLKDLLLYIQQLSSHLAFIGSGEGDTRCPKTWEDVLKKDLALLTANIAACPVQEIRQVFDLLETQFDSQRNINAFVRLMEYVFSMYQRMDEWYSAIIEGDVQTTLKSDLQSLIQSHLAGKLEDLLQIAQHARHMAAGQQTDIPAAPHFMNAAGVWGDLRADDRAYGQRIFIGKDDEEKLINASLRLKEIFDTAWHVTSQVVDNCNQYLDETLHAKKDHQPHIALLITFLELFGYAQTAMNKIPQKHLDYYYGQVLGLHARKAAADRAFVSLQLEKGYEDWKIPGGTILLAGKDRINKDRIYVTEKDVVVSKAMIAAIRTLYIDKDRHNQVLQYYTNAAAITAPKEGAEPTLALFGDKTGLPGGRTGFAISSAQFYLTRGERNVTISIELEKDIPVSTFDAGILELRLTGEKGWLSSDMASDGILIHGLSKTGERMLELSFTVAIGQPSAIIAFDKKIHTGQFNAGLPVLQCLLAFPGSPETQDTAAQIVYQNKIIQLNSLHKIRPVNVIVTVQVGDVDAPVSFDGVRELSLQNHEAVLDAKKPFFPFTSIPKVGSSFYIGCKDLFYKPIQKLSLNIEWMLPDRFRSYYDKYLPPYDSNKFRASLSILHQKKWRKISDISLIDTDSADPRWRSVKIDPGKARASERETGGDAGVGRFDTSKQDGMLKLKLNYPDFGHSVYTQLVTSTVMGKAASAKNAPDYYKMVKQQLHDSVISIKLPSDAAARSGPFKVIIYDLLESKKTDDEARTMMIKGMSTVIKNINGNMAVTSTSGSAAGAGTGAMLTPDSGQQRVIVNDDNFIERIFGFLRRVKVLSGDTHYDKDRQDLGDVVENVKEKIEPRANFILPADKELVRLIIEVTNSAIDQTVVKVADELIGLRKTGVSEQALAAILKKEFDESNEVINDLIAGKIAAMLQASEIPPPPYTPQINMISLSYVSSRRCTEEEDMFYRVDPFGVTEIRNGDLLFDETLLHRSAGAFFIGLRDCRPGQSLSLLFRLAEGTSRTDLTPPGVSWLYLHDKEWVPLPDGCLVSDSTYGLQASGILQLIMPDAFGRKDGWADGSISSWICAAVQTNTEAFPCLIDIIPNTVTARFRDNGNDTAHGAMPLPAGTINRLVDKIPPIKKVFQSLPSFHGRTAEQQKEFYTRVSERLRHKSRAINNWDYEHLVLEAFPEVYKVKCLNDYRDGKFARGHVTVVPIGDLRSKEEAGMLIPRVSYTLLRAIERYLRSISSPFVRVHAINPELSRVEIGVHVRFAEGEDKGLDLRRLNSDLINFLTPWAADRTEALSFSAKIYASNVISFIDRLDYVDYVEDLEMRQYSLNEAGEKIYARNAGQGISLVETQFISGHAILISAPVHDISRID